MKSYDELKALIEQRGVHAEFGAVGEGWGIEQNPHELATFLVRMQELGIQSVLEIGTGYKGGLSRFLAQDMGYDVTTVDIQNYGHMFEGVHYVILPPAGKGDPLVARVFDLVFIDGNHDYEQVAHDYVVWRSHAAKVIAFHDVAGLRGCEGVKQFWGEIAHEATEYTIGSLRIVRNNSGFNEVVELYKPIFQQERAAGIGWIEL